MRALILSGALAAMLAGCAQKTEPEITVEPLASAPGALCLERNAKVRNKDFHGDVQSMIEARGITVTSYETTRPESCAAHVTYTALYSWELAIFMAYARLEVFEGARRIGKAEFDGRRVRSAPGPQTADPRYDSTVKKLGPMIERLFPR